MTAQIDKHSQTWKAIEKWIEGRIEKHRDALENRADPDAHGRLLELRALQKLVNPPKPRAAPSVTDQYA